MTSRAQRLLPFALVLGFAIVARADGGRVVHEFVPGLAANEGTLLVSSGGELPGAIVYRGEVLPAPEGGALGADEAPMRAGEGDGRRTEEPGRRSPSFSPDRVTELNGRVGYFTVFTPSIAPFKRVTGLDTVVLRDGTPVLEIADSSRHPVEVVGAHAPAPDGRPRDEFWGSVVLDFSEGRTVPLPAISPESRVLTLQTNPPVALRLERDGADNLFATLDGTVAGAVTGTGAGAGPRSVRVIFLMDAPRSYFGRPIPDGPVDVHADRVRPLPAATQRDAEEFLAELGLSRASRFPRALRTLTRHFRSFEESPNSPRDTGNIFLDLARGMKGICRHRAYGFVVSAQALGMHARFAQNEAHAWVEVELPDEAGWLRVDLGGAATGLDARGGENRPPYRPEVGDTLPRPPAYERAYEQASRMSGLRDEEGAPGGEPTEGGPGGTGGTQANGAASPGGSAASPGQPRNEDSGHAAPLELTVDSSRFEVFRGHELVVTGAARGGGQGVPGLRVEAVLRAPRGEAEWLLGVTVTGEQGRYRGVFGVPPDLAVGDYRLVVRTPGSREWSPALAR